MSGGCPKCIATEALARRAVAYTPDDQDLIDALYSISTEKLKLCPEHYQLAWGEIPPRCTVRVEQEQCALPAGHPGWHMGPTKDER